MMLPTHKFFLIIYIIYTKKFKLLIRKKIIVGLIVLVIYNFLKLSCQCLFKAFIKNNNNSK